MPADACGSACGDGFVSGISLGGIPFLFIMIYKQMCGKSHT